MIHTSSSSIPVLTDPFDIIAALCDAEEWELARRLARAEDERARDRVG